MSYENNVFVCFRAADIENPTSFIRNLSNILQKKGFNLLMDDSKIEREEDIEEVSLSVLKVLIQCKRSIVVFSKNFAASPYHLDQLAHIVECRKAMRQLISPIYYDVNPYTIPCHRSYLFSPFFDKAMTAHKERCGTNYEKLQKWDSALYEVCYEKPAHIFETGHSEEYGLAKIQDFVESVTEPSLLYDVFLSFCGEDSRYSFTGYLYDELLRSRINTFMDDEGLVSGNEISKNLLEAIQSSKLSIVVLSENYAYSTWCLDELVKILECVKTKKQLVLPIFYKMEHSNLSNQGDAMTAHENRFGKDSQKVQKWRSALSQVASLKGEHIKEDEYEYEIIKKIVKMADELIKARDTNN